MSNVVTPASIRWREEARKSRRRLYPVTVVYALSSLAALACALNARAAAAAFFWLLGVAFWTWLEYKVHRHVLHGVFPDGPGLRHHSVHYYHFDNHYFRYIKRHHLYHHSRRGTEVGYGLTSGLWDAVHGTRIPAEVRAALYGPLRGQPPGDRSPHRDNRLTPRLT